MSFGIGTGTGNILTYAIIQVNSGCGCMIKNRARSEDVVVTRALVVSALLRMELDIEHFYVADLVRNVTW
jgi:hypothetical protein